MAVKSLLIISILLIIVGAILKITHTWTEGNNWVFVSGYVFGAIYFLMRGKQKRNEEGKN